MGSKRALTTAYHPQADGQTEILNQTIEVAVRAFINLNRDTVSKKTDSQKVKFCLQVKLWPREQR